MKTRRWITGVSCIALCCTGAAAEEPVDIRALLAPRLETVLSSRISARIEKIGIREGEAFRRGDLLVKFDCVLPVAQQQKAEAELRTARMQLEANLDLSKHDAIAQLEVGIAQADVDKAEAQLDLMRAKARMCQVHAPFNGRVVKLLVNPYQSVGEGTPLMEILDDQQLKMELIVPSHWLRWLKPGTEFDVHIDETGMQYPAVVTLLGARVDPVSQTLPVTAEIKGEFKELLAGMSGSADLSPPDGR